MDSTGNPNAHLAPIDDTDFKVADGDPDPRGWEVISADGREVGEIDDLIVDTSAMKVRYLVCDLDEDELGLEDDRDRQVLIPVGRARLNPDDKKLMLDGVTVSEILTAPPFTGVVSDQHERFGATGGGVVGGATDDLVVKKQPLEEPRMAEEEARRQRLDERGDDRGTFR
jgi:hypothetical protein